MRVHYLLFAAALVLLLPARLFSISVAAWLTDLQEMSSHVRTTHPNQFFQTSQQDFDAAVDALDQQIPQLTDGQIVV